MRIEQPQLDWIIDFIWQSTIDLLQDDLQGSVPQ